MPKAKKPHCSPVDQAVREIMEIIECKCEPSVMSQQQALDYYDSIISEINMRQEALREEMGED